MRFIWKTLDLDIEQKPTRINMRKFAKWMYLMLFFCSRSGLIERRRCKEQLKKKERASEEMDEKMHSTWEFETFQASDQESSDQRWNG